MEPPRLPTEMLMKIAKDSVLTQKDLFELRSAARVLRNIVAGDVFRSLRISSTATSANGFLHFVKTPYIRHGVEKIVFVEAGGKMEEGQRVVSKEEEAVFSTLEKAFAQLHTLSNLQTLVCVFTPLYAEPKSHRPFDKIDASVCREFQWSILGSIFGNPHPPPALRTFMLENLLPCGDELEYEAQYLPQLVRSLHHLAIKIPALDRHKGLLDRDSDIWGNFWDMLNTRALQPATALRSLTLHSADLVGMRPHLDFKPLNYDHLVRLSLGGIMFDGTTRSVYVGVEDFVVRHASTLEVLEMHHCAIYKSEYLSSPERFWADVWERFARELRTLKGLEVAFPLVNEEGPYYGQRRYASPRLFGSFARLSSVPGDGSDGSALMFLKVAVAERNDLEA